MRAVLFYSPTCGHCHQVMTQDLPPLVEKYGQQLDIIGIDVTQPAGQTLFQSVIQHFNLTQAGVPTLVIDKVVLVGSVEIPEKVARPDRRISGARRYRLARHSRTGRSTRR